MSVTRRDMLAGASATFVPLHGIPTLGGLALGQTQEDELDALFERLDRNVASFREATMPPGVQAWFEAHKLPGDTFHTLLSGLLTTSLVRDLPAPLQAKDAVQERLQPQLEQVGRAALGLRGLFASVSDEKRREVGRRIAAEPALVGRIKSAMEPWFGPGAVEPERREQVFKALDKICWELANGDAVAVFDDPIRQVDRFERMADALIAREEREAAANGASTTAPSDDECGEILSYFPEPRSTYVEDSGEMKRRDWYKAAKLACAEEDGGYDPRFRPYRQRFLSRRFLMIGAALTGLGVVTIPVLVGLCIITAALLLMLTALVLYIASKLE